jgi:hypothetical protein
MSPARADFSAFPLVHYREGLTTNTYSLWAPWPFVEVTRTTESLTYGLHPLFSWYKNYDSHKSEFHLVWPLVQRDYEPIAFKAEDWRTLYIFPLYFSGHGTRDGETIRTRYLLPILYQGRQGPDRKHFILFPFIWYARDARLIWPLFPTRPQTFFALWPLYGDFRGYWNRDRIRFALWPIAVRSQKGHGDNALYVNSFLWPFFSVYSGKHYSGFRAWPLYSYVKKKDEFFRSYWLWPLGHHRTGLTSDGKTTQSMTVFFPLYANVTRGNTQWDLLFPFYGRIQTGKRTARGYLAAIYNVMEDQRTGLVERRLFWFLLRWRTLKESTQPARDGRAPPNTDTLGPTDSESANIASSDPATTPSSLFPEAAKRNRDSDLMTGFAFFPFYKKMSAPDKFRQFVAWPFFFRYRDRFREYDFNRTYLIPFYSSQERVWRDGAVSRSRFFLPFFRSSLRRDGQRHRHWLHLWWYDSVAGLDRNYAPLWTFYEKDSNPATGRKNIRVLKGLYEYDRQPGGWTRKSFNLLVFSTESTPERADTSLLWGLAGRHRRADDTHYRFLWLLKF